MNKSIKKTIWFFANGNTAAFDSSGNQIPELQVSWAELYAKFLESKGVDPTSVELKFQDGTESFGYYLNEQNNWRTESRSIETDI